MLNRWEENKVRWSISLHGTFIISSSEIEKKLCQAGEMEIWELTVTSNQTPSKTFRDICVKLNTTLLWIVVHLHVKKKNDSAHQGERTKRRQGSHGRGDNMTLGPSCWEAYKMPLPHTLTFEPTVRRRLAAHTSTVCSNRFTIQQSMWGLALEGGPNHGPFIVIRSLLPSWQSQGLCWAGRQDAGCSESEF